jgi:hypothetical protein
MRDPWKIYAIGASTWINDGLSLDYGHGSWIYPTKSEQRLIGLLTLPRTNPQAQLPRVMRQRINYMR